MCPPPGIRRGKNHSEQYCFSRQTRSVRYRTHRGLPAADCGGTTDTPLQLACFLNTHHPPLKTALIFVLAVTITRNDEAKPYECEFRSGDIVKTCFPCDPAMVKVFGKRRLKKYPA